MKVSSVSHNLQLVRTERSQLQDRREEDYRNVILIKSLQNVLHGTFGWA